MGGFAPRQRDSSSRRIVQGALPRRRSWPYSAEAARKPAMTIMKVTAHQRTSLGMAEIMAEPHQRYARSRYNLVSLACGTVQPASIKGRIVKKVHHRTRARGTEPGRSSCCSRFSTGSALRQLHRAGGFRAARTRLDRGAHRRDPVSLDGGTRRALGRDRGRIRPAQGRCHCHRRKRGCRGKAGDVSHPDRVRAYGRPA